MYNLVVLYLCIQSFVCLLNNLFRRPDTESYIRPNIWQTIQLDTGYMAGYLANYPFLYLIYDRISGKLSSLILNIWPNIWQTFQLDTGYMAGYLANFPT